MDYGTKFGLNFTSHKFPRYLHKQHRKASRNPRHQIFGLQTAKRVANFLVRNHPQEIYRLLRPLLTPANINHLGSISPRKLFDLCRININSLKHTTPTYNTVILT